MNWIKVRDVSNFLNEEEEARNYQSDILTLVAVSCASLLHLSGGHHALKQRGGQFLHEEVEIST